jgi:purine nucleosidase
MMAMFRGILITLMLAGVLPAKTPVLIDTDIGDDIDDALALALALASPELEVRGITTVHGDSHTRAVLLCRFLHAVGKRDIPVSAGKDPRNPPEQGGQFQYALRPSFRKFPVKERAVDFLLERVKAEPGKLTILALGPLTNVAELLTKHPEAKPLIKRIVLMGGALKIGYTGAAPAEPEWNIKANPAAARAVLESGVPLTIAPLDATVPLTLEGRQRDSVFRLGSPLNNQLAALRQLWDRPTPTLFDPLAVALCIDERFCEMKEVRLAVDDKGMTTVVEGKPNARVALSTRRDDFMKWYVQRVTPEKPSAAIPLKVTNPAAPVERGNLPNRVHVIEDYETDIERRWFLAGQLEEKNVPEGSRRACRGVLTNDFDDRMGDPAGMYTAVIFNPVPGPPMGKQTRLGFRAFLKGTDKLRVQIYSLSNGYHRHLTLKGLEQGKWLSLTVDMTQCRKPDGSGGPLAENERIDDIQFYTDPNVELLIDDIILYDAAVEGERRPFPARPLFCGWFDTGRQGQEWPGEFRIVPHQAPLTWKAARSVPRGDTGREWIVLELRGKRPLGKEVHLRFRYRLEGADSLEVQFGEEGKHSFRHPLKDLKKGEWAETLLSIAQRPEKVPQIDAIHFLLPAGASLLLDDVLLYGR